jgi:rhodanese-related sulfurtransferase/DNA-binding transcriptional ArsR family regulator
MLPGPCTAQLFKLLLDYLSTDASHRDFKDRLYATLARVGKAIGNPRRLELVDLLAQGERTVEALARETGMSLANTSQHLQALRQGGIVESRKVGLFVHYRLSDPAVVELSRTLRTVAERQLAELERAVRSYFGERSEADAVSMQELLERARAGRVIVLDTRPTHEYAAGHIAGAVSFPFDQLEARLRELPRNKEYVAYCRGRYCVYADRAVELLRARGRKSQRLSEGFPEWKAAGFAVQTGLEQGALT